MEYILEICTFTILLFGYCIYKIYQYRQKENLFKKVSWCTCSSQFIRFNSLYEYLFFDLGKIPYEQHPYEIADKAYVLNINDRDTQNAIEKILEDYQIDLLKRYSNQNLVTSRFVCRLDNFHYFILTLLDFLEDRIVYKTVAGEDIRGKELEYTSYGSWGHPLYEATYELTDFGVTYVKLLYMVRNYAETVSAFEGKILKNIAHKYKKDIDEKVIAISSV